MLMFWKKCIRQWVIPLRPRSWRRRPPMSLMFPEESAPDLAEELGRHPDIAGDLVLRHALGHEWIFLQELFVSLFRGLGDGRIKTLLQYAQRSLYEEPVHMLEGGDLFEQFIFPREVEGQQFAVFDGFDEKIRWLPVRKAGEIAYPPVFHGEEEDRLDAFLVQVIATDTTLDDKGLEVADPAL